MSRHRHPVLDTLIQLADSLLRVRQATVAGDWDRSEELCIELYDAVSSLPAAGASLSKSAGIDDTVIDSAVTTVRTGIKSELQQCIAGLVASRLCRQLIAALVSDRCEGTFGALDVSCVQLGRLDAAIRAALASVTRFEWAWAVAGKHPIVSSTLSLKMPSATEESLNDVYGATSLLPAGLQKVLCTAIIIRDIRLGLLTNDWDSIGASLTSVGKLRSPLAAAGTAEYTLIRTEVQHRAIMNGPLKTAMSTGGPKGAIGSVEAPSTVQWKDLDAAIGFAAGVGASTDETKAMLNSAVTIRQMRTAFQVKCFTAYASVRSVCVSYVRIVQDQDWRQLSELVCSTPVQELVPLVHEEYQRYRAEVSSRCVIRDLLAAVSSSADGGVRWRPVSTSALAATLAPPKPSSSSVLSALTREGLEAYVDVSCVTLEPLDVAIAQAERFGACALLNRCV